MAGSKPLAGLNGSRAVAKTGHWIVSGSTCPRKKVIMLVFMA